MDLGVLRRWWPVAAGGAAAARRRARRRALVDRRQPHPAGRRQHPVRAGVPVRRASRVDPGRTANRRRQTRASVPQWIATAAIGLLGLAILVAVGYLAWTFVARRAAPTTRAVPAARARRTAEGTAREVVAALDAGLEELDDADTDPRPGGDRLLGAARGGRGRGRRAEATGDTPTDLVTRLLRATRQPGCRHRQRRRAGRLRRTSTARPATPPAASTPGCGDQARGRCAGCAANSPRWLTAGAGVTACHTAPGGARGERADRSRRPVRLRGGAAGPAGPGPRAGRAPLAVPAAPDRSPGSTAVVSVVGLRAVGLRCRSAIVVAGVLAVLGRPPGHRRAGARRPRPAVAARTAAGEEPGGYNWAARDALRAAINRWERPLELVLGNQRAVHRAVLPRLGELADERLRQRHGLTREADPARARALLGEPLWTVPRRPPPAVPRRRATSRRSSPNWRRSDERRWTAAFPPRRSADLARAVLDAVGTVVVGKRERCELVLAGILAGGHVLLEDLPGLGKTLTARSLRPGARARTSAGSQFTPDLLPADVTGSFLYDQRSDDFAFRAGPALHRPAAGRRDQPDAAEDPVRAAGGDAGEAGLGRGRDVPAASRRSTCWPPPTRSSTRAPTRCRRRSSTGSCCGSRSATRSRDEEWEVLRGGWPAARRRRELEPVVDAGTLRAMQAALEDVAVEDSVGRYIVDADRGHPRAPVGAGRRVAARLAGAAAAGPGRRRRSAGRDYVVPEDVKAVAAPALAHRITLRPEMWLRRVDPAFVVGEVLAADPGPGQRRAAQLRRPAGPWRCRSAACREPSGADRRRRGRPPGRSAGRCCSPGCCWSPAVLLGRVDLVVLAAPFALGTACALRRRPVAAPRVEIDRLGRPTGRGR